MKTIRIDVTEKELASIQELITVINSRFEDGGEDPELATSHGKLSMTRLFTILAEDVALAWERPGSWEGSNMAQVLQSHGYSF